jgi:phosphopentomutase
LITEEPFRVYPEGFDAELIQRFAEETGRPVLGNKAASGTEIIEELGPAQLETGAWIVYTSADSVFQIAAHEEEIPLQELYAACQVARRLCDPLRVARVIARPFVGAPGSFTRTYNRHDFGMPPPAPTLLDHLEGAGRAVVGIGKIGDIFSGRGLSESIHTAGNADGVERTLEVLDRRDEGLIFVNLIDFDMLYGHRRNPEGFAACLQEFDRALPRITAALSPADLLILTADHGNDPTFSGTDHTRERVPVLAYGPPGAAGSPLGLRTGFADVAATIADALGAPPLPAGASFLQEIA